MLGKSSHDLRRAKSNKFMASGLSERNLHLANVKGGPLNPTAADGSSHPSVLQSRLEELLVFELRQDGGRAYLRVSVRGLYRHVIKAITSPLKRTPTTPDLIGKAGKQAVDLEVDGKEGEEKQVSFCSDVKSAAAEGAVSLNPEDAEADSEKGEVTYRERLGGYLHPRDMRKLVTPFSASNEPDVIVRRHCILLNFDPLRAVIVRDRLLVIVPEGADSLLIALERRVRGGPEELENSIFGDPSDSGYGQDSHHSIDKQTLLDSIVPTKEALLGGIASGPDGSGERTEDERLITDPQENIVPSMASMDISHMAKLEKKSYDDTAGLSDNDDEWGEMQEGEWANLPYELQCVDACLHTVLNLLSEDTREIQEATFAYVSDIVAGNLSGDPLFVIRHIKDAIDEMLARVKSFIQSMGRVLDEDEDMALMNLSRLLSHPDRFIQPVSQAVLDAESDEPELILEAHMQSGLTLQNALNLLEGKIDSASDLVDQQQDAVRNRILFANMIISVFTLCVALGSFVGSIMGMNVTNHIETEPSAFKQITAGTVGGSILVGAVIIVVLYAAGIFPRFNLSGGV